MKEIYSLVPSQKLIGERGSCVDGGGGVIYDFLESLR